MQKKFRIRFRFLGLFILCGCTFFSGFTAKEVQERIDEARNYYEAVTGLEEAQGRSDELKSAADFLKEAESRFRIGRRKAAAESAENSLAVSRKILSRYYNETIARLAGKIRTELEKKSEGDPDNPLTEYVPQVDEILDYAGRISGEPHIVQLAKVLDDLDNVLQITRIVRSNQSRTLSSDVSFNAGEYSLAERGKEIIDSMISDMLENMRHFDTGKGITLNIRIVGYTDQLNFGKGTELVKNLLQGAKEKMPDKEPERRKFLNQRLSHFRAEHIGNHIRKRIEKTDRKNLPPLMKTRLDSIGRGEQMPVHLPSPYPVSDPRRRICKIHVYITTP